MGYIVNRKVNYVKVNDIENKENFDVLSAILKYNFEINDNKISKKIKNNIRVFKKRREICIIKY